MDPETTSGETAEDTMTSTLDAGLIGCLLVIVGAIGAIVLGCHLAHLL